MCRLNVLMTLSTDGNERLMPAIAQRDRFRRGASQTNGH